MFFQVAGAIEVLDPRVRAASLAAGLLALYIGVAASALFVRETYARAKPVASAAYATIAALAVLVGAVEVGLGVHNDYDALVMPTPRLMFGLCFRTLCAVIVAERNWAAYRAFRRQIVFGLTTKEVLNRVLLYSVAMTCAVVIHLLSIYTRFSMGMGLRGDGDVMTVASWVGVVSGVCLWLAFSPPRWFVRRFGGVGG